MNLDNIELNQKEKNVFCFLYKQPNTPVDEIVGRVATRGIYRNELPDLLNSLERKNVIICSTRRKHDFKYAHRYFARGQMPYKDVKSCNLTRKGTRLAREKCR